MEDFKIALHVPRIHVKTVKSALEKHNLFERAGKITQSKTGNEEVSYHIPTTVQCSEKTTTEDTECIKHELLKILTLEWLESEISICSYATSKSNSTSTQRNPLQRALQNVLQNLPELDLGILGISPLHVTSTFPDSYSIYKPMLLLPQNAFTSDPWTKLLAKYPLPSSALRPIWREIAAAVGASHVAVNAGIPPEASAHEASSDSKENILRSPVDFTPLYGDFGPPPTPERMLKPTKKDFEQAFWVTHTQNGIRQTWAPLYTMFSRGNIREKTRLLKLPSVLEAVEHNNGCTAVDLYAGIGYFAFSYKKAGAFKVLCWELNPWSVEGLRLGAEKNGWTTRILSATAPSERFVQIEALQETDEDVDFVVFQQSNEHAAEAIQHLARLSQRAQKPIVPPIRHVNLGLLPTSRLSWSTAMNIIDNELGGWIHVHENVGVSDIEAKKDEVVLELQREMDQANRQVICEHIERVKTYAPGVLHVVFDIWVDGTQKVRCHERETK